MILHVIFWTTVNLDKKLVLKKLKKERSNIADKVSSFNNETAQYKKRITTLEPLIERLSFRVDELATDRSKLIERITDLEHENNRLSKELSGIAFVHSSQVQNAVKNQQRGRSKSPVEKSYTVAKLKRKENELKSELEDTQGALEKLMRDLKKSEAENSVYFNTITDLQNTKFDLENKLIALQAKDKSHIKTLSKMTYKADEIAKDAQIFAKQEQAKSTEMEYKYRKIVDKLRDSDLEVERLRKQIAIDQAINSLKY